MIWTRIVSVLLPTLLLVLLAQGPVGASEPAHPAESSLVRGADRDAHPSVHGDLTTRKHRHAASIEEYFAIDDDSDQYVKSAAALDAERPHYTILADRTALPPPLAVPRSHRACAAPATGPPHA
jgi:hypothetical protein